MKRKEVFLTELKSDQYKINTEYQNSKSKNIMKEKKKNKNF